MAEKKKKISITAVPTGGPTRAARPKGNAKQSAIDATPSASAVASPQTHTKSAKSRPPMGEYKMPPRYTRPKSKKSGTAVRQPSAAVAKTPLETFPLETKTVDNVQEAVGGLPAAGAGPEKASTEKAGAEKASTEKASTEKASSEKASSEKASSTAAIVDKGRAAQATTETAVEPGVAKNNVAQAEAGQTEAASDEPAEAYSIHSKDISFRKKSANKASPDEQASARAEDISFRKSASGERSSATGGPAGSENPKAKKETIASQQPTVEENVVAGQGSSSDTGQGSSSDTGLGSASDVASHNVECNSADFDRADYDNENYDSADYDSEDYGEYPEDYVQGGGSTHGNVLPGLGSPGLRLFQLILGGILTGIGMFFHFRGAGMGSTNFTSLTLFIVAFFVLSFEVIGKGIPKLFHLKLLDSDVLMLIACVGGVFVGQFPAAVTAMFLYVFAGFLTSLNALHSDALFSALEDFDAEAVYVYRDGSFRPEVPENVWTGETILVHKNEVIPIDGIARSSGLLDTSLLTGNEAPKYIFSGDHVSSGMVVASDSVQIVTTRPYVASTAQKVADFLYDDSAESSNEGEFERKFSTAFGIVILLLGIAIGVVPSLLTGDWHRWLRVAFTFFILAGTAEFLQNGPLFFENGLGTAFFNGVLVRGDGPLEELTHAKKVVFNKTGTLTSGEPDIVDLIPAEGYRSSQLLEIAAKAEYLSSHRIAACIRKAYGKPIDTSTLVDFAEISGMGVRVFVDGHRIVAGNLRCMRAEGLDITESHEAGNKLHVTVDRKYIGCIVTSDTTRRDSKDAVEELHALGLSDVTMLTGSSRGSAKLLAEELGLDEFGSELTPDDKLAALQTFADSLKKGEKLVFVGDGLKDRKLLSFAEPGIALGGFRGNEIYETEDVIVIPEAPSRVAKVIATARKTFRLARTNTVFTIILKAAVMILSIIGLTSLWGAAAVTLLSAIFTAIGCRKIRMNWEQDNHGSEREVRKAERSAKQAAEGNEDTDSDAELAEGEAADAAAINRSHPKRDPAELQRALVAAAKAEQRAGRTEPSAGQSKSNRPAADEAQNSVTAELDRESAEASRKDDETNRSNAMADHRSARAARKAARTDRRNARAEQRAAEEAEQYFTEEAPLSPEEEARRAAEAEQRANVEAMRKADEAERKARAERRAAERAKRKAETAKRKAEAAKRKAAEEAQRKAEEEEARKLQEEADLIAAEEAARKAEEEEKRRAKEEEKRKAEEDRKAAEEAKRKAEEAKQRAAAEAERLAAKAARDEEKAVKRAAEAERKAAKEAERKAAKAARKAAKEAERKAEEEERQKAAEEAKRRAEEEAVRRAEEDKARRAEEAERKAENEAKRKAEEDKRKAAEEERKAADAQRKAAEAERKAAKEAARKAAKAEKKAAKEAARKAMEEERQKAAAEAERRAAEEAKRRAEEAERRAAEQAARRAEEEAKRKAAEEERKAAEELRRQAVEEARRRAMEEAERQAAEEAERRAEEADRKAAELAQRRAEKAERKAAIAERKAKEEADRQAAKAAREAAIAERKAADEATRKVVENAERKAAEAARIAAEAERRIAEAERKAEEIQRKAEEDNARRIEEDERKAAEAEARKAVEEVARKVEKEAAEIADKTKQKAAEQAERDAEVDAALASVYGYNEDVTLYNILHGESNGVTDYDHYFDDYDGDYDDDYDI